MKTKQQLKYEAWEAYEKVIASAWETYKKVQVPALEAYKKRIREIDGGEEK